MTPADLRTIAKYLERRQPQGWLAEVRALRILSDSGSVSTRQVVGRGVDERTARRVVCRLREALGLREGERGQWVLSPSV